MQNGYVFVPRVISISSPTLELLQDRELEVVRPGTVALGAEHFHGVFLFGQCVKKAFKVFKVFMNIHEYLE